MKLHIVVHESFEISAAIEQWALRERHDLAFTRLYAGDVLPENADDFDFLFVMGGPHSLETTDCPHYDPNAEMALIRQAMEAERLVLGVCLGAQLIGQALGARYEASPHKEIGVFDIRLTDAGKQHAIFSDYPESFPVAHWHNDMPGLTEEAIVLAESDGCPRQIIQYTDRVYGFQCHCELTPEAVSALIESCGSDLDADFPYIQSAEQFKGYDHSEINQRLFTFLDFMQKM
jgi:GMP synthase (glutamine-hydrolysing)